MELLKFRSLLFMEIRLELLKCRSLFGVIIREVPGRTRIIFVDEMVTTLLIRCSATVAIAIDTDILSEYIQFS